jgi:fructokinase
MRYGIDLGGTKIEIIVLDEQGNVLLRERAPTPKGDYAGTLETIELLIRSANQQTQAPSSIGIGIPGAVSKRTGRIENANSTWLIGEDLQGDLERRLRDLYAGQIKLANDANCFALSEATDGAAAGAEVVFGVIIGTGCGAGIVVNGQILNGINSIGGEWGHNPLPWADVDDEKLPCYCGLTGCNETFLSGSGFEKHFSQKTGISLTAKEIVQLAQRESSQLTEQQIVLQPQAQQALERYQTWLAKGLASVINVVDPDVIVLGGGMGNIDALYEVIPQLWGQWVFSDSVETKLVKPKFGDSSGVRGAAWL